MSEGVREVGTERAACERCGRSDGRRTCVRCGNYFCWDCGGEDLDAHCRECVRHVGALPWDRSRSPVSFVRTVWAVATKPSAAMHLRQSHADSPLPFGFAAIALSIASVTGLGVLVLVVLWQQHEASVRLGVENMVITSLALETGPALAKVPLDLVMRTALDVPLLVGSSRLGARRLSWRVALRSALYGASFAALLAVPLLGFAVVYLAPRFMLRVAAVEHSVPRMVVLAASLCVAWLGIGMLDQLVIDDTVGPWLEDAFFRWLVSVR